MNPIGPWRLAIALFTLALVGVAAQARALEATSLEITFDPRRFTGQMLIVHGTLTTLQSRGRMGGCEQVSGLPENLTVRSLLALAGPVSTRFPEISVVARALQSCNRAASKRKPPRISPLMGESGD